MRFERRPSDLCAGALSDLIWGEKETVTPVEQARDLQKLLPQATLAMPPRLGHIPRIDHPDALNAALLRHPNHTKFVCR